MKKLFFFLYLFLIGTAHAQTDMKNILIGSGTFGSGSTSFSDNVFSLDASGDFVAGIFQAETTSAITTIGYRYGVRTGTPPVYRISLQALGADGRPTGTVLGGGSPASITFTPPADATWNNTTRTVTLTNSYAPAARGEVFAVVIEYSSGTINGSNFSSFGYSWNGLSGSHVPNVFTKDSAGGWTLREHNPSMFYRTASATYGFPFTAMESQVPGIDQNPREYALKFSLPSTICSTYKIGGVSLPYQRWGSVNKSFFLQFYEDGATATTRGSATTFDQDISNVSDTNAIKYVFPEVSFDCGTVYRIGIGSADSGVGYRIFMATVGSNSDLSAFPGGATWTLSTRTTGNWTDVDTKTMWLNFIVTEMTAPTSSGGGQIRQFNKGLN